MAKKPKTYSAKIVATAARTTTKGMTPLLKQLGITPFSEATVGDRTYRSYDQAALDAVVAWRKAKDAAAVSQPSPAPAPPPPLLEDSVLQNRHYEVVNGQRFLNSKMDRLNSQMDQILETLRVVCADLGIKASVAGAAQGQADDAPHMRNGS
jgi:hypothetical protein